MEVRKKNKKIRIAPKRRKVLKESGIITKETYPLLCTDGVREKIQKIQKEGATSLAGRNSVACIISNGSCVNGFGAVGPKAIVPVLESKALFAKEFGGVVVMPLAVDAHKVEDLFSICKAIAPSCGAIVLDSIEPSVCFSVSSQLLNKIDIPVFDTYQYGVAIAVLAGLINAHTVVKKHLKQSRVAILGAGPISTAVTRVLLLYGVGDVIMVDRDGILHPLRTNIDGEKEWIANATNKERRTGGAVEAVIGADVVLSISKSGPLKIEYVRMMAQKPIVFALRDPEPELSPKALYDAGAVVVATGNEKYPNYVTDALVLPYILKGILGKNIQKLKPQTPMLVAEALAGVVAKPSSKKILPTVFDRRIGKNILDVL